MSTLRRTSLAMAMTTLFLFIVLAIASDPPLTSAAADGPTAVYGVPVQGSASISSIIPPIFEDSGIVLPGTWQGDATWGDYDGDGDLDIVITSCCGFSEIFRNDGSDVFTDIDAGLEPVNGGSVAWGDYDRDGDLDLLLAGSNNYNLPISKIYRNDGNDIFTDINAGLIGVWSFPTTAWGDYDNDGDLDFLLAGLTRSQESVSIIYRNDGDDVFTDAEAAILEAVSMNSMAWGDYDNDDDLDILWTGWTEQGSLSKVYQNDGGTFTDANIALENVNQSAVAWGDYDNDGDLDILLAGYSHTIFEVTRIYRNGGGGDFTDIHAALTNVARGPSAAWGDYDNDGDPDILLRGCAVWDDFWGFCNHHVTQVYRNDGGDAFVELDVMLPSTSEDAVEWGDYDNDGDLDILVTGNDATQIFRNNIETPNSIPFAPDSLRVSLLDGVRFEWDAADDAETASPGLHYNLRVGTTPGGVDVVAPMAVEDGYRQVVALGNANQGLSALITGLPPGTYYWSVQAIDTAFAGSPFAAESNFTIRSAYLPIAQP